jgi:hypothetical protein
VTSKNAVAAAAKRCPRSIWSTPLRSLEPPFGPVGGPDGKLSDRTGQVSGIESRFHHHYRIIPRHLVFRRAAARRASGIGRGDAAQG